MSNPKQPTIEYERPLSPVELQVAKNFADLDILFNRQVLETSRAAVYGAYVGVFTGFLVGFKLKSPTAVGLATGAVTSVMFNNLKFGPWYSWCFRNWNEDQKNLMKSLKENGEVKPLELK